MRYTVGEPVGLESVSLPMNVRRIAGYPSLKLRKVAAPAIITRRSRLVKQPVSPPRCHLTAYGGPVLVTDSLYSALARVASRVLRPPRFTEFSVHQELEVLRGQTWVGPIGKIENAHVLTGFHEATIDRQFIPQSSPSMAD